MVLVGPDEMPEPSLYLTRNGAGPPETNTALASSKPEYRRLRLRLPGIAAMLHGMVMTKQYKLGSVLSARAAAAMGSEMPRCLGELHEGSLDPFLSDLHCIPLSTCPAIFLSEPEASPSGE